MLNIQSVSSGNWCCWRRLAVGNDRLRSSTGVTLRSINKLFCRRTCRRIIIANLYIWSSFGYSSINLKTIKKMKILNGGYLGFHIEEERSELRYAMWIAGPASHQIFERNKRKGSTTFCMFASVLNLLQSKCDWTMFSRQIRVLCIQNNRCSQFTSVKLIAIHFDWESTELQLFRNKLNLK